jgi:hypothetical protein
VWLAARPNISKTSDLYIDNPLPLTGVVDLDGPTDLKAMISIQQQICGSPVITDLMGGSPNERAERYHAASPMELLPLGVRQELFTGQAFAANLEPYEAAATKAGDVVTLTVLPGAGHFVFIDPQSDVWPQVMAAVRRLLKRTSV